MQTVTVPPFLPQQEEADANTTIERLYDELEMMDYVIAHDVQAPLRIIQSCYEELNTCQSIAADAAGHEALQMLGTEASRMKILLQGVLDYVRLETFIPKYTLQNSDEIVASAIATLAEEIQRSGAIVTCDPLPKILGHRGRLIRLFSHLLDNALKFHSARTPIIHIYALRIVDTCKFHVADTWQFCVEDNGIGIDEQYSKVIFRLFQRLHTADAYPGHGIGLALSHKIVEGHSGKLWVEPVLGGGSRFCFTLPIVTR